MGPYIARRVGQALLIVVGVSLVVFALIHSLPGGPARALLGTKATPGAVKAFDIANGYNQPVPIQYVQYLWQLMHGNLGYSYYYNEPVTALLLDDLPKTAVLVGLAYLLAIAVAIPMGVLQATRRNRTWDHVLTTLSFVGYSMPTFWLGLILILIFGISLKVLPSVAPQGTTIGQVLQSPAGLVLPVATLAVVSIAQFARFVRSSTIDTLLRDYVRTADAKGVPRVRLLSRHVLRNSLLPVITVVGLSLPNIFSGAIVVEAVFNYPGMGQLLWNAAAVRDYPVLMGFTIVVGCATVAGSLLADVLYAVADPRIRYA